MPHQEHVRSTTEPTVMFGDSLAGGMKGGGYLSGRFLVLTSMHIYRMSLFVMLVELFFILLMHTKLLVGWPVVQKRPIKEI